MFDNYPAKERSYLEQIYRLMRTKAALQHANATLRRELQAQKNAHRQVKEGLAQLEYDYDGMKIRLAQYENDPPRATEADFEWAESMIQELEEAAELDKLRREYIHDGIMGCGHKSIGLHKNRSGLIYCKECYPDYDEELWEFAAHWDYIKLDIHYPNICRRPASISPGVSWACRECSRRMLMDIYQIILTDYRNMIGDSYA